MQTPEELINQFHIKLLNSFLENTDKYDLELSSLYSQIIDILIIDYPTHRQNIGLFLTVLEENHYNSVALSLNIFFSLYNAILSSETVVKADLSALDEDFRDETSRKFLKKFEEHVKRCKQLRISDFDFSEACLTTQEAREIASFVLFCLRKYLRDIEDEGQFLMLQLPLFRYVANFLKNPSLFYLPVGMFLDQLNNFSFYQQARDLAEEIVISSFNDDCPEYGFLNSYRCYSSTGSTHAAVLYANLSMRCIIQKEKRLIDKYLYELICTSLKYFRNISLHPLVKKNVYKPTNYN